MDDSDSVIFTATSIRKIVLKWDVNDCKIKVRKKFTQKVKNFVGQVDFAEQWKLQNLQKFSFAPQTKYSPLSMVAALI